MEDYMQQICRNCGLTYGSHHAGTKPYPMNYCPGHEGKMDWDDGPGSVFSPSPVYYPMPFGAPAKKLIELGYANAWNDTNVPEIVKQCEHKTGISKLNGSISMIFCMECRYVYFVDSSD